MENLKMPESSVKSFGKLMIYPDGSYDLMAADRPVFGQKGLEESGKEKILTQRKRKEIPSEEDLERARRRARSNVRRLALANEFRWFVTLTLDPKKIDRYDVDLIVKRMSQWCSNQVKRKGLRYILVPELHRDGAVHFHGFFSDDLRAVDSGVTDSGGHRVFNLPDWTYGFTTAIELYGERRSAVGYVCKYIGKDSRKIGGRWYYSGGNLQKPVEKFVDISSRDVYEEYRDQAWVLNTPGGTFAGVNGLKEDQYGKLFSGM